MARSIAVRVGRVWQSLTGGPSDTSGVADAVSADLVSGSGAVFGGNFGGVF